MYLLVKVAPGAGVDTVRAALAAQLPDSDVHTTAAFSAMTRDYWMFTTGAGVAVLLAAALGLVVGIVVVAQTIYATTMDHLREYGTLKAMGATNAYLYKVIVQQAVASAIVGYLLAMAVSYFVVKGSQSGGATWLVPSGDPVAFMGDLQKIMNIGCQSADGKNMLQILRNRANVAFTIAQLEDLGGATVQLHHAFRIEQHIVTLRVLPLQAEQSG